MTNSGYYSEVIVAAVDIMGIKNLLTKNDKLNTATKIIGQLCGNINNNPQLLIQWKQFGDSAYLIANPNDPLDTQLSKIAFSVANLTGFGMFAYELNICDNFLLRSGISKGDLKTAQWTLGQSQGNLFIGNSMAKAFKLERAQNWFGACIDFEIDCSNLKNNFIIEYDEIPIKGKWKNKKVKGYAINWLEIVKQIIKQNNIKMNLEPDDIIKHIEIITKKIGSSKSEEKNIKKKIKNTKKFVKYCLK